ncbi:MAG: D-alanyl-D-alanine carboxypeptidase/D-alanyl-D-alanine-endopeptidase [Candidatus Solibacter usitatus]|nr:D-alanyl-D-alanine carboxypeptidase/D-alanyl-D-alanine-endopeptidase [Candidatus Solibacter usitatus]
MRTAIHALLTALLATLAVAQTLEESVEKILAAPAARKAAWGVHVIDLASGRTLYARNAGVPFTPASNTKLFSTALALMRLGPDYRFETRVLGAAPGSAGRMKGDLRLVGGGDPTLSARAMPYQKGPIEGDPLQGLAALADEVVVQGVRVVEGNVIGDDTLWPWQPYPEGWAAGDLAWEYGAAVSALTLNDNAISITVRPGQSPGAPAELALRPAVEHFTFLCTLRTEAGAERKITLDRAPGSSVVEIGGAVPPNSAPYSRLIAVEDPARFAAEAFLLLLRARGVSVGGAARTAHRAAGQPYLPPQGVVLARRLSPPLLEIARVVDKVSQNLHAEILLREVGRVKRGQGTAAAGQDEMEEFLLGLGIEKPDFSLEDGSGLSRRTLISPTAVTSLLGYMHQSPHGEAFWSLLPVAGEDGTLSTRFRGVDGASSIRAKTGTISHVAALSGYAGLNGGRRLAFSIIANGATGPAAEVRAVIDRIAVAVMREGQR